MFEIVLGAIFVLLFVGGGWAFQAAGEALIWAGLGCALVGFGYGIPTAVVYHWRLYKSLVACDRLPSRWWLQPTALHGRIPSEDRRGVLLWGAIGGSGFCVIVVGILLTTLGLWRTLSA